MRRSDTTAPSYEPVLPLGRGGMAAVELALRRREGFHRLYALKRPLRDLVEDPAVRAMFMDEARLAGLVRHPNAIGVLDVGEDDRGPYLVMEYVEGVSLAALLAKLAAAGERVPVQACLNIAVQAARGLHAAHEVRGEGGVLLGLVHRDVSPQNVLLGFDGVVRVTDFGIAKAMGNSARTSPGVLKGNVGYLAPECLRFEAPDRRADVFALGVVLYEMLSGERLYRGQDATETARKILDEPPPDALDARDDLAPDVVALLLTMLAKEPERRPATAALVADRLEAALRDLQVVEEPLDLRAYLHDRFGRERQARAAEIEAAVRRVLASPRRTRDRRWLAAGGIVAAIGAVALWAVTRGPAPHGLRAEYFDDVDLREPRFSRVDPYVYFDWNDSSPDPRVAPGSFSVRWSGWLLPRTGGSTRLCVASDDGARLWVDDRLVIDEWRVRKLEQDCVTVPVQAGGRHALRLEYFQHHHHAIVHLLWETPDRPGKLVAIPIDRLRAR